MPGPRRHSNCTIVVCDLNKDCSSCYNSKYSEIYPLKFGAINVGFRSAQFVMLADNVSGRIRSDFFASIANKDLSFFDRVNVGEICKF
jgi:hypothetical protein